MPSDGQEILWRIQTRGKCNKDYFERWIKTAHLVGQSLQTIQSEMHVCSTSVVD